MALTEGFLELCKMGKHDDETKTTNKYYVLYTLSLTCQKKIYPPKSQLSFISFAK